MTCTCAVSGPSPAQMFQLTHTRQNILYRNMAAEALRTCPVRCCSDMLILRPNVPGAVAFPPALLPLRACRAAVAACCWRKAARCASTASCERFVGFLGFLRMCAAHEFSGG